MVEWAAPPAPSTPSHERAGETNSKGPPQALLAPLLTLTPVAVPLGGEALATLRSPALA